MAIALKGRIFSSSANYFNRPVSYKRPDVPKLNAACEAIRNGISICRAAEEFGIARSTLGDHYRGRILPGAKPGSSKYLNDSEESELVRFLLQCAAIGFPKTRKNAIALVQHICDKKQLNVTVTHGWWESFCSRHSQLKLRTAAAISVPRAIASNPEVISSYFDMFEKVLMEYDLFDKLEQIFNIDETGMPLGHRPPKIICKKGVKNPLYVSSGNKTQITVVACTNAAGYCIPPMVIWNVKTMHAGMIVGSVRGTVHAHSENGWMDKDSFHTFFSNLFLRAQHQLFGRCYCLWMGTARTTLPKLSAQQQNKR